jgi:guanine nucleotide-binding protein G(i) subunit alpha
MKLIHHGGYNESERESYREIIFSNTIQSMRSVVDSMAIILIFTYILPFRAILEAMPQLDLALSPQNDARRATILALPPQIEADILPADVADAVQSLWRDASIKEAVRRSREFQLNDSAVYYFDAIDRMASPSYLPTDQDILRSRVKTTGITETTFKVGELTYKLFDVGGQRSERKKWIHCFENVTALVFLVSLSEYDQMLYEDESVVRLSIKFATRFLLMTALLLESYAGSVDPVRLNMQFPVVCQDFYSTIFPRLLLIVDLFYFSRRSYS